MYEGRRPTITDLAQRIANQIGKPPVGRRDYSILEREEEAFFFLSNPEKSKCTGKIGNISKITSKIQKSHNVCIMPYSVFKKSHSFACFCELYKVIIFVPYILYICTAYIVYILYRL